MFDNIFENASNQLEKQCSSSEYDYIENELLHCGICKKPKQIRIKLQAFDKVVRCLCKCEVEADKLEKEKMRKQRVNREINHLRETGIPCKNMRNWTFEKDNGSNPKLIEKAHIYVNEWETMKRDNIGLLFFGDIGTGKTFAATCIANALIDMNISVIITDFSRIINDLSGFSTCDKNAYIDKLTNCELLIIDDLGVERQSDYSLQIVENVIDSRYKANKPLILTTNIPIAEINNPKDIKYKRIYSRISAITTPIQVIGTDKRKDTYKEKMNKARQLFAD